MTEQNTDSVPTYEIKPHAATHTCWDDPKWDGCMVEGCLGCDEAEKNPCRYCGYGHVFTTHNPDPHYEGGDPSIEADELKITQEWFDSPHLYAQINRSEAK